jgi:RNA polymerase sigma-70 factor (ECF subfamily)
MSIERQIPIAGNVQQIVTRLGKTEYGKLVSVLTRIFGTHNLSMAEDVVQDVFIKALEVWSEKNIPDNPEAWLFRAAKNRAIDIIRKNRRDLTFATDINPLLESEYTTAATLNDCFKDEEIRDDQLRMMFACCHPGINAEGQIALILKTLSGFSIAQIARAFITTPDTIEKRLYRAKQAFREHEIVFDIPQGQELQNRLDNVLEVIYLLFNEAHSSSYHDSLVRGDLAVDTIKLCELLVSHPLTNLPQAEALLALLFFHTSRMPSRLDANGELLLMKEQDRSLWNRAMIEKGLYHLRRSAGGDMLSRYHLEAAIAYEHCKAQRFEDTDWESILYFYDLLKQIVPSPVVLLNRAVVIKELKGAQIALECIRDIPGINYLKNYYLLHAILGELNSEIGKKDTAKKHYEEALRTVVSAAEKQLIEKKLSSLN